jgi:hypothetical protein
LLPPWQSTRQKWHCIEQLKLCRNRLKKLCSNTQFAWLELAVDLADENKLGNGFRPAR